MEQKLETIQSQIQVLESRSKIHEQRLSDNMQAIEQYQVENAEHQFQIDFIKEKIQELMNSIKD